MSKYLTIQLHSKTKIAIDKLAEKNNKSILKTVDEMVIYFEKTGINPSDLIILSPAEELKKFRDTIIGFLRKQEKDFILPVFSQLNILSVQLSNYIENEAPKTTDKQLDISVPKIGEGIKSKDETENKPSIPTLKITDIELDELKKLREENEMLNLKYDTVSKSYIKIINNIKRGSVGMQRANIIDLPIAEITKLKDLLKIM
ncbi:MAG: BfmA/BtgA family mobilization protein [Brumimicrobium sp.]